MTYLYPTQKQHELITLIYRFRFLNRIQLQALLHHKDKRRINAWLKELTENKYLGRIYSIKLLENTKPAIYYLSHAGILYVRDRGIATEHQLKKYYEDNNRSQKFIDHSLLLGTVYLQLLQGQKKGDDVQFLTRVEFGESEALQEIHPSAYYAKRKTKHYFVELFDAGMPRYAIRGRIRQYIQFYWSASWEQETKAKFPTVLLISSTEQIQRFLWKFISATCEEEGEMENLVFSLTTKTLLETQGMYGKIWRTIK